MVLETYRPRRYYKRKTTPPDELSSRVQITLLEYGLHGVSNSIANRTAGTDSINDENPEVRIGSIELKNGVHLCFCLIIVFFFVDVVAVLSFLQLCCSLVCSSFCTTWLLQR